VGYVVVSADCHPLSGIVDSVGATTTATDDAPTDDAPTAATG